MKTINWWTIDDDRVCDAIAKHPNRPDLVHVRYLKKYHGYSEDEAQNAVDHFRAKHMDKHEKDPERITQLRSSYYDLGFYDMVGQDKEHNEEEIIPTKEKFILRYQIEKDGPWKEFTRSSSDDIEQLLEDMKSLIIPYNYEIYACIKSRQYGD